VNDTTASSLTVSTMARGGGGGNEHLEGGGGGFASATTVVTGVGNVTGQGSAVGGPGGSCGSDCFEGARGGNAASAPTVTAAGSGNASRSATGAGVEVLPWGAPHPGRAGSAAARPRPQLHLGVPAMPTLQAPHKVVQAEALGLAGAVTAATPHRPRPRPAAGPRLPLVTLLLEEGGSGSPLTVLPVPPTPL